MTKFRINEDNLENFFCCSTISDKICEGMVEEHMLGFVESGEMTLVTKNKKVVLRNGEAIFIRRSHLITKVKRPKGGKPFKALFLKLNLPFLKSISKQIAFQTDCKERLASNTFHYYLPEHPFMTGLFQSLDKYFTSGQYPSPMIVESKLREAVLVMLELKPQLAPILFDFEEPWKIDFPEFMERNYCHDLTLEQLAHYTGRSLSGFKRDFADAFGGISPMRWIVNRRLDAAMEHLKAGMSASEVYLNVGFKNLSHFSTAFKRKFGILPSEITPA